MELLYWVAQFWVFKVMVGVSFILIGMHIGAWLLDDSFPRYVREGEDVGLWW